MNCTRFRYQLSVDPFSDEPELLQHASGCQDCAARLQRAQAFEEQLRAALSAELEGGDGSPGTTDLWPDAFTLGAIGLLSLSLLVGAVWFVQRNSDGAGSGLADMAIGHILGEPELLQSAGQIAERRVGNLLASLGWRTGEPLGAVNYAGRCRIGDADGIHLVLPGREGSVTALMIPSQQLGEGYRFSRDGFDGLIVPIGSGVLAVVGRTGEAVSPIAARLARAVGD